MLWGLAVVPSLKLPLAIPRVNLYLSFDLLPLASDDVNHTEHHDPDCIYKVPIQCKDIDALSVFACHFAEESENHDNRKANQAYGYVKRMQAHKRVVGRSKKIRADAQSLFENQVMPFDSCFHHKYGPKSDR